MVGEERNTLGLLQARHWWVLDEESCSFAMG